MKRVLKWTVPVDDEWHDIGGGDVVGVACQTGPDVIQVWTEEWEGTTLVRSARVFGTGHVVPMDKNHVGMVLAAGGRLVWHVYTDRSPRPGKAS